MRFMLEISVKYFAGRAGMVNLSDGKAFLKVRDFSLRSQEKILCTQDELA